LNPDNPISEPGLQAMQAVAKVLKVVLEPFNLRGPNEFEGAFSAIAKKRVGAIALIDDGMLNVNGRTVAALAEKMRLPSIGRPEFAEAGGMLGYGVNVIEQYRRVAYFVDRILK
jgi:putative ABC transport system substrate-binding protein